MTNSSAQGRDAAEIYPNDSMNRVGPPDADDEMYDPLEETNASTVIVTEVDPYVDQADFEDVSQADIDQTRAEMGQTIDAIQDKLRPQTLAQQAKDAISQVGSHAKDTLSDVTHTAVRNVVDEAKGAYHGVMDPVKDTVGGAVDSAKGATMSLYQVLRDNPIPIGMAAIGIFWFYRNMRGRQPSGSYNPTIFTPQSSVDQSPSMSDQVSGMASQMKDQAGQMMGTMQDKMSDMKGAAQDKIGQIGDKAQQTFGQVSDKAQQTFSQVSDKAQQKMRGGVDNVQRFQQENPLMLGAMALLAGAVIGMMLPSTDVENRMMGNTRDRFADKMTDKAQDLKEKVGNVAQQVMGTAKDTAVQEAKNQGLMSPQSDQPAPPDQETSSASVNEIMGVG
jgi:ElaB/YqjD/DUF883 family membrane-anchored ribosome-binding protein